jgi:hypothetical protein
MTRALFIVSLLMSQLVFSQEDTLRVQQLDEMVVSFKKEIAYGDREYFITDFHVGVRGRFVLMKRFSKYRLHYLDENMQAISQLDIDSRGKRLKLYEDCLGFLHLMAPDSLHQLEVLNDKEVVIWESNPISVYHRFLKNCIASNEEGMITKKKLNFSQTTAYYQQLQSQNTHKRLYVVEDSTERKLLESQFKDLPNAFMYDAKHISEIDSKTLGVARNAYNQEQFFFRHVVKPTYNPLFVKDDTTYIFDHVNDKVALLCDTGRIIREIPVDYHLTKHWEDKVLFDNSHERFYTMEEKGGVQTYCMLSSTSFKVIRKVDITEHAYPRKVIIYNGYAYYLYKADLEDNLNKLFRQRLI